MARLIDKFSSESGFKVLAMAKLSQVEYGIVLYLINCAASNLSEVITNDMELSSLVGHDEGEVRRAIDSLVTRQIIKVRYGTPHQNPDKDSLRIGLQFDLALWKLGFDTDVNSKDAVVFPFRRAGVSHLQMVKSNDDDGQEMSAWKRILDAFVDICHVADDEMKLNETAARVLAETHPIDQVLLMIRHFRSRVPTLSLLASSWQHFQEVFVDETQKIDLLDARLKHSEMDEKLRKTAKDYLADEAKSKDLNEEERTVLEILSKHRHPRRQMFWAYQLRNRYPNLTKFFADHSVLMLGVTTTGKIIPRKD